MARDGRVGSDHWKGCHTFTDITFDGSIGDDASRVRNGALKMDGTYWYYVGGITSFFFFYSIPTNNMIRSIC